MDWLFLLAAGLVEVAFALSIEPTKGFTRPLQTALCFVLGAGSIYLLTHALKTLPIGTAYAVFTGIGAIGTVVLGIVLAGDPATPGRLIPIALIVAGSSPSGCSRQLNVGGKGKEPIDTPQGRAQHAAR